MTPQQWAERAAQACAQVGAVPSPCNSVCSMADAADGPEPLCRGCWRSLGEIAAWARMDDAEKRAVWAQLPQRAAQGTA